MTGLKPVWAEAYSVHSYEVDREGHVTAPHLCRYLQETAYYHAEHLGVGHSVLSASGRAWMLLGLAIRMDRYPRWHDTITVRTWPSARDRIYYHRDFRFFLEDEPVGIATTKWITVDIAKHRPCRTDLDFHIPYERMEKVWPDAFDHLRTPETEDIRRTVEAGYLDLDVNAHVNNIRFMEWILDGFSADFHQTRMLMELAIRFQAEAVFGDRIHIRQTEPVADRFEHSLIRERDGRETCRACSFWAKKSKYCGERKA
ncbi:MAG TPA: hypothetical protein ENN17_03855 [bacterium]|nr:hypothetical protein [bacterium]